MSDSGSSVLLRLESPPRVVNIGLGRHGLRLPVEQWLLPELCSVHLYGYHAEVTVAGVAHPIRPGSLSIIPAGTPMEFRHPGPSEHLYAHLRLPTACSRTDSRPASAATSGVAGLIRCGTC